MKKCCGLELIAGMFFDRASKSLGIFMEKTGDLMPKSYHPQFLCVYV